MCKEIIAIYSESHTKPTKQNTALQVAKITETYNYRLVLKG
jgi:hypothetical protein